MYSFNNLEAYAKYTEGWSFLYYSPFFLVDLFSFNMYIVKIHSLNTILYVAQEVHI